MTCFINEDGFRLRRTVRAVVVDATGQVLLIRPPEYPSHRWTLPGGSVEAGERPVEAMRRKLQEELGLLCGQPEQLPVRNRFIYSARYRLARGLNHDGQDAVMFFVRVPCECQVRIGTAKIAEVRWFEPEDAMKAFPAANQSTVFQECMVIAG